MKPQKQSLLPSPRKSREVKKLEAERDRAKGQLLKMKAKKKRKKVERQRQTLGRQVVNLTVRHTQALIDGEI